MINRSSANGSAGFLPIQLRGTLASCLLISAFSITSVNALAGFSVFHDESAWRAAADPTVLEDFESFTNGTQIPSLPKLNLAFDELAGGGHPQAYLFGGTPYGPMHLGNFPNGINLVRKIPRDV